MQPMTQSEFHSALEALDLTQSGCATFLGVNSTTVRRWASGEIPISPIAARLLRLMVREEYDVVTTKFMTHASLFWSDAFGCKVNVPED